MTDDCCHGNVLMLAGKMAAEEEQLLLRAEIFRSKLIEHFQLLDTMTDKSSEEIPKYYSDEVKNTIGMNEMMRTCSNALVKFQVYDRGEDATYADKRLNRIKTKNTIPMGPWAKMVVENNKMQNFMLILIILNSIVLGIQAEISSTDSSSYKELKVFLNIFDYLSLMVFILEILLKWIDGFFEFWKNGWNVFDFFVTVMSFVPELIKAASPQDANESLKIVADNLRTFRILRSLKMVSRFAQLRIIVLTMLKALKSMAFILMLLATFMYIFAVTGTVMFTSHHKSTRGDILYKHNFSNLVQSLLTLFQLFTLDHWFEILNDLGKTSNDFFSKMYIILWICVGAFIFKNVFTGIMVMNFQNIRNEFVMQCKEQEQAIREIERRAKLEEELTRQYRSHSVSARRKSSVASSLFTKSAPISQTLPGISEEFAEEEEEYDQSDNEKDDAFETSGYQVNCNHTSPQDDIPRTKSIDRDTNQMSGASQILDTENVPHPTQQSVENQVTETCNLTDTHRRSSLESNRGVKSGRDRMVDESRVIGSGLGNQLSETDRTEPQSLGADRLSGEEVESDANSTQLDNRKLKTSLIADCGQMSGWLSNADEMSDAGQVPNIGWMLESDQVADSGQVLDVDRVLYCNREPDEGQMSEANRTSEATLKSVARNVSHTDQMSTLDRKSDGYAMSDEGSVSILSRMTDADLILKPDTILSEPTNANLMSDPGRASKNGWLSEKDRISDASRMPDADQMLFTDRVSNTNGNRGPGRDRISHSGPMSDAGWKGVPLQVVDAEAGWMPNADSGRVPGVTSIGVADRVSYSDANQVSNVRRASDSDPMSCVNPLLDAKKSSKNRDAADTRDIGRTSTVKNVTLGNIKAADISEDEETAQESNTNDDDNTEDYLASASWNKTITANLANLKDSTNEVLWPRDSLFRYFQLMEALQDNLAERGQLQKLAVLAINQMHDGKMK